MTLSDQQRLALWAADCAARVQPAFIAQAPDDPRPQGAIDLCRAWAKGEIKVGPARAAAVAAHAAARAVGDPAAIAAARAAGHAAATAHMSGHARHAAAYALKSVTASQGPAAAQAEADWQSRHRSAVRD